MPEPQDCCPDCDDLLQHHYDNGCSRCPCMTSNAEASYRLELARP